MDTNLKVLCGLSYDLPTLCLFSSTQTYTDMLATHPVAVIVSVANHVVCDPEDSVLETHTATVENMNIVP